MPTKAFLRSCVLPAVCGLLLSAQGPARAGEPEAYTISGEDGYGISECMHSGSACGRVIADSWCESHGHAHVLAFGVGADVTGSVQAAETSPIAAGDVVIRCGD